MKSELTNINKYIFYYCDSCPQRFNDLSEFNRHYVCHNSKK